MKVMLTGTTGYIAKRLLPVLLDQGHEVVCCVRDRLRFDSEKFNSGKVTVIEVVCRPNNLSVLPGLNLVTYKDAIKEAFEKIDRNIVLSSWKDALTSDILNNGISKYLEVPVHGCYLDSRILFTDDPAGALLKIWSIGGKTGWYYGDWLWELRGFIDKVFGGVGLRRGRKNQTEISPGEVLDFWRVLIADKKDKRLLLFAEMKLPGVAWLEFICK